MLQAFESETSTSVRRAAAWTLRSTASASTWRQLFSLWHEDALPRHRTWACELAALYAASDVLEDLAGLTHDIDGTSER